MATQTSTTASIETNKATAIRAARFKAAAQGLVRHAMESRAAGVQGSLSTRITTGLREAFRDGFSGPHIRNRPLGDHPPLAELREWITAIAAEILNSTGAERRAGSFQGLAVKVAGALEVAWRRGDAAARGVEFGLDGQRSGFRIKRADPDELSRGSSFRTIMSRHEWLRKAGGGDLALMEIEKGGKRYWREVFSSGATRGSSLSPLDYPAAAITPLIAAGLLASPSARAGIIAPTEEAFERWSCQRPSLPPASYRQTERGGGLSPTAP